ncbi:MAG: SagB/ThcOx family dehydrogenase [Lentisphaeria bacterium]
MIELSSPSRDSETSLEEAITSRRSIRAFRNEPLGRDKLSQLLWAAQGITDKDGKFRAAPSAGATYPLEVYVVSESGMYRYVPAKHALEKLSDRDNRTKLARAALGQESVAGAPVNIVFTAVYKRTARRYGIHARRYVHMEAGHAAQNLLLQAVSLELGGVPVGAFDDEKVGELLDLPDNEKPLYIIPVGVPAVE